MKKLLILSILAAALLCGCSNTQPETTTPATEKGAIQISPSQGLGQAVTPEEGDIQIPIG